MYQPTISTDLLSVHVPCVLTDERRARLVFCRPPLCSASYHASVWLLLQRQRMQMHSWKKCFTGKHWGSKKGYCYCLWKWYKRETKISRTLHSLFYTSRSDLSHLTFIFSFLAAAIGLPHDNIHRSDPSRSLYLKRVSVHVRPYSFKWI